MKCFCKPLEYDCDFSIGGESLAVAQNTYAVSWFKGKELNMVFGLQLSLARIVSVIYQRHKAFINIIVYIDSSANRTKGDQYGVNSLSFDNNA